MALISEWQHYEAANPKLTTTLLNENNYLTWVTAAELTLDGRGKLEFVTREEKKPEPVNPQAPTDEEKKKIAAWRRTDKLVMSWLVSSMEPSLARLSMHAESSKEIWDNLREMYGLQNNLSHIYMLQQELHQIKQGNRSNTEYLVELRTKLDEIKVYRPPTSDLKVIQQREAEDEIFLYLSGLDQSYENLKANILQATELPSLKQVAAKVQKEESRRLAMGTAQLKGGEKVETHALAANSSQGWNQNQGGRPQNQNWQRNPRSGKGKNEECTYCKKVGHIRDNCWFLYPHLRPKEGPMAEKNFKNGDDKGEKGKWQDKRKEVMKPWSAHTEKKKGLLQ